ncbi:unnamed protein product, partial [Ilex paraguariensis]
GLRMMGKGREQGPENEKDRVWSCGGDDSWVVERVVCNGVCCKEGMGGLEDHKGRENRDKRNKGVREWWWWWQLRLSAM